MVRGLATALVWSMLSIIAGMSGGCATAPADDEQAEAARNEMRVMADDTLKSLYARQPKAQATVEGAAGYAVFSNFGMKVFLAGGGSGRGIAIDNKTKAETFMRMAEVQAGLGYGVKRFRQVWVFQSEPALRQFIGSGYQFGGSATLAAKAGSAGGSVANAISVSPGVWVYQLTDKGLAAEITAKGTRYYRDTGLDSQ